jgi:hypothetical protein
MGGPDRRRGRRRLGDPESGRALAGADAFAVAVLIPRRDAPNVLHTLDPPRAPRARTWREGSVEPTLALD